MLSIYPAYSTITPVKSWNLDKNLIAISNKQTVYSCSKQNYVLCCFISVRIDLMDDSSTIQTNKNLSVQHSFRPVVPILFQTLTLIQQEFWIQILNCTREICEILYMKMEIYLVTNIRIFNGGSYELSTKKKTLIIIKIWYFKYF